MEPRTDFDAVILAYASDGGAHRYKDLLDFAFRYYGNSRFTWVILDANSLQSELDINVGDVLFIPNFEEVAKISG